jgi:hypothetical protein
MLPDVKIKDTHWKVGDGMNEGKGTKWIIGQIAYVVKKNYSEIVFFDTRGKQRGRIKVVAKA